MNNVDLNSVCILTSYSTSLYPVLCGLIAPTLAMLR